MPFRSILEFPSRRLQKKSSKITDFDTAARITADLIDTLNVCGGVGLSAPQIGFNERVIFVKTPDFEGEMVNPQIMSAQNLHLLPESCLSLPGIFEQVERFDVVKVQYQVLNGETTTREFTGLPAQVVQHEIEHLDGKLILNHMTRLKRSAAIRKIKKLQRKASGYIDDNFKEPEITKIKKNAHLSKKEIKIRKNHRKQNR